ncbi:MAG TPA: hypothetical protein VMU57_16340 [Edaphobacter sp.]|uniref:beta-propeller domain-containing protein n=1 Tax=Edaphobacter sp. TaxID=1934404 RepID=UPI002C281A17|nr:hypothetical protein [Edaphobacter sp.]HUZ96472.1 hypothetical protein [Edaphobacter sp.]
MHRCALLILSLAFSMALPAQSPGPLSGKDLARHDFLYAGEAKDRQIFMVRQGKIVWSYEDPAGKGEISDAVQLCNGNILFAHQFALTEISPDKKIVWNYDVPAGHEVHTAVPIGNDRVLYIQNGSPALLRVVNVRTGTIEKELTLKTRIPVSVHGQFRHARLTPAGTLLVAHMDLNKVVEYDSNGNELWSFPAKGLWSVAPLDNGNVLITDSLGVREVTRRGDVVWSFSPGTDAPAYKFDNLQQAWRLPDGNTVINNWVNEWSAVATPNSLQAIEVTPAKKVVWVLRSWDDPPANLGPATTFQFLDQRSCPENAHFGDIK